MPMTCQFNSCFVHKIKRAMSHVLNLENESFLNSDNFDAIYLRFQYEG